MKIVRDILQAKGEQQVWSVEPGAKVYEALVLMAERNVGALPVVEDGRLCGILSERDYARKVVLKGRISRDTLVREIMTESVLYVGLFRSVDECMALMTDKRIRHLPVIEDGRLVGIVSIGDLVKALIAERDFQIEQLTSYITGQVR
jgi:CBS domain-containing protein